MATFDHLPADQRAILELVVGRGQSYAELSTLLGMPASRVRELAREALAELAPATAKRVDPDWRGQVADYVLGQQTGPESTATRGHLKRSEPARAWAFSLLDSLSHLYPNGNTPAIPDADDRGAPVPPARPEPEPERAAESRPAAAPAPRQAAPAPARPSGAGLSPAAQAVVRRRRIVMGVIGVAVLAVVVLLITGVFGGGGSGKKKEASSSAPTSARDTAYEVWLYNTNADSVSLGAQFTDAQGNLQGRGDVPSNWQHFKTVVLSSERVGTNPKAPSNIVLQATLNAVPANQQRSNSRSAAIVSEGVLKAAAGAQGTGVALVVKQGSAQQLVLQAAQLKPTARVLQPAGPTGTTGATGATGP